MIPFFLYEHQRGCLGVGWNLQSKREQQITICGHDKLTAKILTILCADLERAGGISDSDDTKILT
jgi:hypothetical protein